MPIVIDPNKQVTDPTLLSALAKQGIDYRYVELYQDYAPAYDIQDRRIKGRSPYAKFYRHTETNKQWMVVSQLPMVNADGVKVEVGWQKSGANYVSKVNQFQAQVSGKTTTITVINDQPTGQKKGDNLTYTPHLYLDGVEVFCGKETLLAVDPVNSNYQNNVLEWDYGICKRRLRLIEGKILGTWVFAQNPNGEVRIHYDQAGDFRLHLGHFAVSDSEELIPASAFEKPLDGYPFVISDSFYPDAHPESTSVDGRVYGGTGQTWDTLHHATSGAAADSESTAVWMVYCEGAKGTPNTYSYSLRTYLLFDTSSLPDSAIISAAILSIYGTSKTTVSEAPTINIYAGTPFANTSLTANDYNITNFGTGTAFATAITYANWSITGYNDFTLNASGIAAISLISVSKFAALDAAYDVTDSPPTPTATEGWGFQGYFSEKGNGYKPKLVVTYTVDQPFRNVYPHILAH